RWPRSPAAPGYRRGILVADAPVVVRLDLRRRQRDAVDGDLVQPTLEVVSPGVPADVVGRAAPIDGRHEVLPGIQGDGAGRVEADRPVALPHLQVQVVRRSVALELD